MSKPPLIFGPVPPYNNPPIMPHYFKPRQFDISNIAIGTTTVITTAYNMDYVIGQLCRVLVPKGYGCREINEMTGYVISIPTENQVILDMNSQYASSFISADLRQSPQIVAVGDINTGHINPWGPKCTKPWIPGSFRNISPFLR